MMDSITTDLRATIYRAISPTSLGIWLRAGRANR